MATSAKSTLPARTGTSIAGSARRGRILVVGPVPPPTHGVAVMTRLLLDSPLAAEYELIHLDTSDRRGVANIGRFDMGNVMLALRHGAGFLRLLASGRVDAVYVPVAPNTLGFLRDAQFLVPALLRRVPLILHLHSGGYGAFVDGAVAPLRWSVRKLLGAAARVIILGDALRPMLKDAVAEERIAVVPNAVLDPGVAEQRASGDGLAAARAREGPLRVLFLGNLIASKGYIELIRAVEDLLRQGVDIELTLAGGIADERSHAAVVRSIRQPGRIHFAGVVDGARKAELLRRSDVVALPTYYESEGHPLVLLEAMAAGLPVVSTKHVAIPETVVDGETGLLVERRDASGLGDALKTLAREPALRAAMGRAARQRYLKEYTVERWSGRMRTVFDAAMAT